MAIFLTLAAGAINVNAMNRGSTIAVGEVSTPGWSLDGKANFGNGQQFGANLQTLFVSTLLDNDVLDSPISEIQPSASLQNQTL